MYRYVNDAKISVRDDCAEAADEIERLRGLLREWFDASDPSIGGSPGSLLERTRAAIDPAQQT